MTSSTVGRGAMLGDFNVRDIPRKASPVAAPVPNSLLLSKSGRITGRDLPTRAWTVSYAGVYKIAGIVQVNGEGTLGRVLLAPHIAPSLIIREAYTGSDGVFTFNSLAAGRYIAWAMTNDGSRDIVAHEYVLALPMNT